MSAHLFNAGEFRLKSGLSSSFKIDCDALTDEDCDAIAIQVAARFRWKNVVSCGGASLRLARALDKYNVPNVELPTLVVDDVWTTGATIRKELSYGSDRIGIVLFARERIPISVPVTAVFSMWGGS